MSLKNALGGIALIAGTAIGAAVLALPVATAHIGFINTILLYCVSWFFMTVGALYLLEANLSVGYETNLVSMAEKTLGGFGKYLTWITYLILLYALTAAYLTGVGAWLSQGFNLLQIKLTSFSYALMATFLTMAIIFLGTAFTDWINRFFMIGLIGAFFSLLYFIANHISIDLITTPPLSELDIRPIPLIITAFGSAIVIPSLTEYLHGKPKQLFYVVLIGCAIPLAVYIIWEFCILSVIPVSGNPGLLSLQKGEPVTDLPKALAQLLNNPKVTLAYTAFSIFALVTSLLGVCLSLFDFLADGLHMRKSIRNKLMLSLITFAPPLAFTLFYPRGFTLALSFAGIFVAILLGILPTLMVYRSRYQLKRSSFLKIAGGRPLMFLTLLFFLFVIGLECYNQHIFFKNL